MPVYGLFAHGSHSLEQGTYTLTNTCKTEKSQLVPSFFGLNSNPIIDVSEKGNILGVYSVTTWEWHPDMPVRSFLPTFATTGLPLLALRLLFGREGIS